MHQFLSSMFVLVAASPIAFASSSGGEFAISNHTLDSGGGTSSGGQFTVSGTIGQADASLQTAAGGAFQLTGGFWANGIVTRPGEVVFSDSFESLIP